MQRNGVQPFESYSGLSNRSISELRPMEAAKMIPNLAIFGRPIQEGMLTVTCINRVILRKATYSIHFGPAGPVSLLRFTQTRHRNGDAKRLRKSNRKRRHQTGIVHYPREAAPGGIAEALSGARAKTMFGGVEILGEAWQARRTQRWQCTAKEGSCGSKGSSICMWHS